MDSSRRDKTPGSPDDIDNTGPGQSSQE
jgi:hypothetical protein